MIKNETIIRRLTIEERLQLIVSKKLYANGTFSYYEFPIFELLDEPLVVGKEVTSTVCPSKKVVLNTWNFDLFAKYGFLVGNENARVSPNLFFKEDGKPKAEITDDPYLYASFISEFGKGVCKTRSRAVLELDDVKKNGYDELPYELLLEKEGVNFVLVSDVEQIYGLNNRYHFNGCFYAKTNSLREIARFINAGVDLIYYTGENYESLIEVAGDITRKYDEYQAMLKNGQITEDEFNRLLDSGEIISPSKLTNACDRMLDLLKEVENFRKKDTLNVKAIPNQKDLLNQIARESIVLLKNENNILPLPHTKKVALIGDCVKNMDYYLESSVNTPRVLENIFEEAEKCELLNCIGYAHGYHKGTPTKDNLLKVGLELVRSSNVGVVFLFADEKNQCIPQEQLDFFNACVYESRKPIVAVLYASCPVDLYSLNAAKAIVLVSKPSQGYAKAIIDVLVGNYNPSGKLSSDFTKKSTSNDGNSTNSVVNYPFGHGLSYTKFSYSNLEIKENGVHFTLTNTGEYAGSEVVFLYVSKEESQTPLSKPVLKGFKKVFVEKGDSVKVFIPFDDKTFRYYDQVEDCYGVEGGEYKLTLNSSKDQIKLSGTIKLSKYLNEGFEYNNKDKESFSLSQVNDFMVTPRKQISFKVKLAIGLILAIYFTISFIIMIGIELFGDLDLGKILFSLIAMVGIDVGIGIYLKKSYANRVVEQEFNPNETLTLLMDDIKEYKVTGHHYYDISPKDDIIPEEVKKDQNQEVEEEEEVSTTYENEVEEEIADISEAKLTEEEIRNHEEEQIRLMEEQEHEELEEFSDDEDENVVYDEESSIQAICDRLISYSKDRGIVIELSSCRNLISSLCSSHIVILNCKTPELINEFLTILNDYFGNKGHITTSDKSWTSPFFLTWKKEENGNYVKTDFVNDIHNASKYKNSINISFLTNVDHSNFENYFSSIIEFALRPTYVHYLKINQKQAIQIPSNTRFIIVPNSNDFLDNVSHNVLNAITSVDLFIRKTEQVKEEVIASAFISYTHLLEEISVVKNDYFLKEETWKKIDHLIEEMKEIEDFRLGNKNVILIETFTSVYMECGADEADALDAVLTSKIVPLIKGLDSYKLEGGEKAYIKLIEKEFGKENVTKTIKALKKVVPSNE